MTSEMLCFLVPIIRTTISFIRHIKCGADIYGIIIPQKSGKTSFVSQISSSKYCLIDLDENIKVVLTSEEQDKIDKLNETSRKLHLFPLAKKYVKELRTQHRDKKLIILSSSLELVEYCGINKKDIYNFAPSNSLSKHIKCQLSEEHKASFEHSKLELALKADSLITYNSFEDLSKEIMTRFKGLQLKF